MNVFFLIPYFYLLTPTTSEPHQPKVHESNSEHHVSSEDISKRTARQSFQNEHRNRHFQPPTFNFRQAQSQQDLLKFKYFQQQKSDFESYKRRVPNSKIAKTLGDFLEKKRDEFSMNIPFDEQDWVPITSPKNILEKTVKELQDISDDKKSKSRDLESSDSENIETKVKPTASNRKDAHAKYIYIQPSILKNSFGLDSKTAQDILNKAAPSKNTGFQLNALENLLHKNPEIQLEGLQKLLQQSGVYPEYQNANLDEMQESLEGAGPQESQSEDDAFTLAQKQANAHLEAQHKAIAQAQKKLEADALAKIAAHNNGQINIDPKEVAKMQDEAVAHLKLLAPSSSQLPHYEALVGNPSQTYGGHFNQAIPSHQQYNQDTADQVESRNFPSSTPRTVSEMHHNQVPNQHQQIIAASTPRTLYQHQVQHSPLPEKSRIDNQYNIHLASTPNQQHVDLASIPKNLLQHYRFPSPQESINYNQHQTSLTATRQPNVKEQEFYLASTPRNIIQRQELSPPIPQTLQKAYIASTPRTVIQQQRFPSSTPKTLLEHQQIYIASTPRTVAQHQGFPSSTPQSILGHQGNRQQIYIASTPRPMVQHQGFPSSTPQTIFSHQGEHQQIYIDSTPKTQFYTLAAPQPVLRHPEQPSQQVFLPAAVAFKNLPPISNPPKLIPQPQRSKVYFPQVQVHPVPQHIVNQNFIVPNNHASRQQNQVIQHPKIFLSTPEPPRVNLQHQVPVKYKQVAYSSQVNHLENQKRILHAQNHGYQVNYAPSYRAPVPEHAGVSYVNIVKGTSKAHDVKVPDTVQFVGTPVPHTEGHHVLSHELKSATPNFEENSQENLENYEGQHNHLNYDDLNQYAANYAFGYKIADHENGNDFGHEEKKDGKTTKGHYHVNLPDGRRQKVEYFVDDEGYHANVSYENIATHA